MHWEGAFRMNLLRQDNPTQEMEGTEMLPITDSPTMSSRVPDEWEFVGDIGGMM